MNAMLQEVFYWVFNMSITAAITGTFVLLIRMVRKIPRRLMVLLWFIPFFRMAVPLGLNSPYSLMSLLSRVTTKTVVVFQPAEDVSFSIMNSVRAAESYFPLTYKANLFEQIFHVASVIWIIVFFAILLTLAGVYFTTLHEMKNAEHLRENIYLSEKAVTPAVYGIVKPRIILPTSYADQNAELILMHERVHLRRVDNLWRVIAILITAAHWFNPLAWVFLKRFLTELELSCDEWVLMKIGDARAGEYALSLLESKESVDVFASAFGGARIRSRIENILSFRKMTWFSLTVFLVLMAAMFYGLLTNAA